MIFELSVIIFYKIGDEVKGSGLLQIGLTAKTIMRQIRVLTDETTKVQVFPAPFINFEILPAPVQSADSISIYRCLNFLYTYQQP